VEESLLREIQLEKLNQNKAAGPDDVSPHSPRPVQNSYVGFFLLQSVKMSLESSSAVEDIL